MNADVLVEITDLNFSAKGTLILDNVSLNLNEGSIVTLIGPNGAGKTTLISAILGLLKPTSGKIICRKNLRIGYMPQKVDIDPTLPLNVTRFLELSQSKQSLSTEHALNMVKAKALAHKPLAGLSGGELQRILLAKAVMRRPNLLVLDEPMQGVDIPGQEELYKLIEDIKHKFHCGILLVSHDLHFVFATSDYVICLNKHICCAGTPRSVTANPHYQQLFGHIQMPYGLVPYTHSHDHSHDEHPDEAYSNA